MIILSTVEWMGLSRPDLSEGISKSINVERINSIKFADTEIDDGLDHIFEDVEKGIDGYLDWYYTVIGEYQRLVAAVTTDISTLMLEKMEFYLFNGTNFTEQIEALDEKVENTSATRFTQLGHSFGSQLEHLNCDIEQINLSSLKELNNDKLRSSAAIASGAGTGIVATKVMSEKDSDSRNGQDGSKKIISDRSNHCHENARQKGDFCSIVCRSGHRDMRSDRHSRSALRNYRRHSDVVRCG